MRRRTWAWIGLAALVLLNIAVITTAVKNSFDRFQDNQSADSNPSDKEHKSFWQRTTDDPVAAYTLILTFATVVSAWSTFYLWRVTEKLVSGAEDTARRQLRAYLSIHASESVRPSGERNLGIVCTNHGQTPATKVDMFWYFSILDEEQAEFAKRLPFDGKISRDPTGMTIHTGQHKGSHIILDEFLKQPVGDDECLCIIGYVRYLDFQGNKCETRFRQRRLRNSDTEGWSFCAEGNDAD